jgi:hypothetical protein
MCHFFFTFFYFYFLYCIIQFIHMREREIETSHPTASCYMYLMRYLFKTGGNINHEKMIFVSYFRRFRPIPHLTFRRWKRLKRVEIISVGKKSKVISTFKKKRKAHFHPCSSLAVNHLLCDAHA